jgi:hypothetical protein
MRFGIYLVRRNLVTAEEFVAAAEQVIKNRVPIGRLAVEARYISVKQVFEVLDIQAVTGERFGEIAVRLGYLTDSQLAELLARQAARDETIGEVLVQMGAIPPEVLEAESRRFHAKQIDTAAPCSVPVEAF